MMVQTLVEKSLVKGELAENDALRYDLLETLREYAREQLARAQELNDTRAQHAAYYRRLAHAVAEAREHGTRAQAQRFDSRDAENFRLALDWYAEHDPGTGSALATDLHSFWADRGLASEGRERLTALLRAYPADAVPLQSLVTLAALAISQGDYAVAQTLAGRVQARTAAETYSKPRGQSLLQLGYLALMRGEFARAQELLLAARAQFQALDLPAHEARALNNLGLIAKDRGEWERAQEYHLAALALRRELGLRGDIAQSLFNLAIVAYWRGEYARAIQIGQEAYELFVADAGNYGGCYVLETIGMAYFKLGQFERAVQTLNNSLAALRRADDKRGLALLLHALGDVALAQRDYRGAQQSYREALQLSGEMGEKRRAAFCLEGYAAVLLHGGNTRRAVSLLGAAEALREAIGVPVYDADRAAYDAWVQQARQKLGEAEFADAWVNGRALEWQQAIGLAMI
jgi:tetratricopeptide (TPR) repeat protein